jgi:dipeptidyl aminopeptidase/acylaminoacyl peptidase
VLDSRERDTAALFAVDNQSGETKLLHEDARADANGVIAHPATGVVQAVGVNYLRSEYTAVDPSIQKDLDALKKLGDGEFEVTARTLDDKTWVVLFTRSDASAKYYLYDRESGNAKQWIDTRPALKDAPLVAMHPQEIKSRDGLTLPSYLTLPKANDENGDGKADQPAPMVLFVHGGPWARDTFGLNRYHQWLANRGYAVLSVNYRASTGFGKKFLNAGNLEWGKKMHDDLLDAVDWAVKSGVTSKDKVAIMGGSYGGYATLAGLTMTPTTFACGVDIVGPSNLFTLLNSIPPYWASFRKQFYTRMGDPNTEEGKALLKERSPLTYADKIERPLLIGQGQNDPRVNVAESQQIVDAMKAKNIPVTYVVYPDEGHGFARPPNNISFNAISETFLGKCLGGRAEPIGADFKGASITIPEGAGLLTGVAEAMTALEAERKPAEAPKAEAAKPTGT